MHQQDLLPNPATATDRFDMVDDASARGRCFKGVCAVYNRNGDYHVALIAPDMGALRRAWDDITDLVLREDAVQEVVVFGRKALVEPEPRCAYWWDDMLGVWMDNDGNVYDEEPKGVKP